MTALEERSAVTRGLLAIRGEQVPYEARAESVVMRDAAGAEECSIFAVTYTRTDVADTAGRPIIYAFDGGPGTATVTLHMSLLGPRRAVLDDSSFHSRVPPRLVDNPYALLDVADIVVIDAPGTGFSRPAPAAARRFFGYTEDVRVFARFIGEHLGRTGRWASPVVVLGESYGGMRACGLAFELEDRHGVYPAGVALVVPALSSQALLFAPGNDLPYVMYLPMYAAVARYHGRAGVGVDLRQWLDEAEAFALGDFASALLRGGSLPTAQVRDIAERMAAFTGLSARFVESCNLRVSDQRFFKELLRSERHILSRADPRTIGLDRDAAGEEPEHDPFTAYIRRAFAPAVNHYLRDELGYTTALEYPTYDRDVLPWDFHDVAHNRFAFPVETLRLAMSKHPSMQVLVATGLYDGSVPSFAVNNVLDRAIQEPALQANITRRAYETGHILYFDDANAARVSDDIRTWLTRVSASATAARA